MFFGYVTNLGRRGVVLLLALAVLLLWAGRSDASQPQENRGTVAGAGLERAPLTSTGADLAIRGDVAVLHLPEGDGLALAARIAGGERAEVVVRIAGQEVLVAELRNVTLQDASLEAVAKRLLDDPQGIVIAHDDSALLAVALRTHGAAEQTSAESRESKAGLSLDAPAPRLGPDATPAMIPEPSTAALLGSGLLGLHLAFRRRL